MNARIHACIVLMTSALFLVVGLTTSITDNVDGQTQAAPEQLNPTTVYFAEGMEISPMEPQVTDEYQSISIPNGFIRDGLRGHNLLPIGHTYWKSVGTWHTPQLKKQVLLGGRAELTFWAYKEDTGNNGPVSDFRFEIMRGSEILLDLYVGNIRITEGQDTIISATGSFPPANDTAIPAGTSLSVRVSARCNGGGAVLKFGTKTYPSGISFGSNSLVIQSARMTKNHVVLEYKDAFMVPWTKMYTMIYLNRELVDNEKMSSVFNSVNMSRELHWEKKSSSGEYEIMATIGYTPAQNISVQKFVELRENKQKWLSFKNFGRIIQNNAPLLILVVLFLASLAMYAKHRSRVWDRRQKMMPPEIQKRSRKEQKEYWKTRIDKRRERSVGNREKRVIKNQYEIEDDGEFRIFKRKYKKGEKPRRRRPIPREPVEEIEL